MNLEQQEKWSMRLSILVLLGTFILGGYAWKQHQDEIRYREARSEYLEKNGYTVPFVPPRDSNTENVSKTVGQK